MSYAKSITDQIQMGVNLKFLRQAFSKSLSKREDEGSGMGMDIGGLYEPLYNLKLGLMLGDLINPKIKLREDGVTDSIPRSIRLGASYKILDDRLLLASAVDKAGGRSAKFHFGVEFVPMKDLALRSGYTTDTGEISLGAGFRVSVVRLDYGFGFLKLGATHRVSLTISL